MDERIVFWLEGNFDWGLKTNDILIKDLKFDDIINIETSACKANMVGVGQLGMVKGI